MLRRRRLLAVGCVAVAMISALRATAAPPPTTVAVQVLTRAVPAGTVIEAGDLGVVAFAPGSVPDDLAADPVGRAVATAVARGEPLTTTRLVGAALATGAGRRAMPVRFPDAGTAGLLRVGDRIDVVAVDPQGAAAALVATDVPVLAVPRPDPTSAGDGSLPGRLVVLGVEDSDVTRVADVSVRLFLTWAYAH